jgi:hypothetical protein
VNACQYTWGVCPSKDLFLFDFETIVVRTSEVFTRFISLFLRCNVSLLKYSIAFFNEKLFGLRGGRIVSLQKNLRRPLYSPCQRYNGASSNKSINTH